VHIWRQLELGGFRVQVLSEIDLCVTWSSQQKNKVPEATSDDGDLPSFINLKKMANKYRSGA